MVKIDDSVYYCDPSKNTECRKTGCYENGGPCRHTTHVEYADTTDYAFPATQGTEWAQIVRCKHCKNKEQIEHNGALEYWCEIVDGFVTSDDYCSWGEPKEDSDGKVY